MINFVFENIKDDLQLNFVDCPDINPSGIPRFRASPLAIELHQHQNKNKNKKFKINFLEKIPETEKYIIASGVATSPDFWTGKFDKTPSKKSVFGWLNDRYRADLKSKKAFLMLDQSHEGYHETWLWEWFHDECNKHYIPPAQIIYVTGNLKSKEQYDEWIKNKNIKEQIKIIPYTHFEIAMSILMNNNLPSVKDHIRYKKTNKEKIKSYNCLQKRPRNHRAWLFHELYDKNLIDLGINSMNLFQKNHSYMEGKAIETDNYKKLINHLPLLPPSDNNIQGFSSGDCGEYLTAFNEQIMLDTWFSIVSEASFGDSSNTCFLSEKTFKPIACEHPFIIYGDKNSLTYLRTMGYKTFHPFINESYDNLPTWERVEAIVNEIRRLSLLSYKEKITWYKNISPILIHNKKILSQRQFKHFSNINNIKKLSEWINV